jgi:FMN phosphatase YigB (HAD superfamily)
LSHLIDAVVFDLGGVLLDFHGAESIERLSGGRVDSAEFSRFWASPLADALYTGRCSVEEFALAILTRNTARLARNNRCTWASERLLASLARVVVARSLKFGGYLDTLIGDTR